jgi:hypothetical protein
MAQPLESTLRLFTRIAGALGGLLGGAFAGIFALIVLIILTGSTFGLRNVYYPGAAFGASFGALLGFLFPKAGKILFFLLSDFSG